MESRRLRNFLQIVDSGSITKAASVLGVAQPALSQQLAVLERELNVRLVERSSDGVVMTAAGRALYPRARQLLRQIDGMRAEVGRQNDELSGVVAIGLPPTVADLMGLDLVERVSLQHPNLRLQLVEDGSASLVERLLAGELDLAVFPGHSVEGGVQSDLLFTEPLFLVTPSSYPASAEAGIAALAALPWVLTRPPHASRALVDAVFTQAGLEPRVVVEIDSLPIVLRAVERGLGVTVLPLAAVQASLAAGRVRVAAFGPHPLSRSVYIGRLKNAGASPALAAVHALVLDLARQHELERHAVTP